MIYWEKIKQEEVLSQERKILNIQDNFAEIWKKENINFIGYEINSEYVNLCNKRLAAINV